MPQEKMIEKKIRITKEQNKLIKLKAKKLKVSEAEIIRSLLQVLQDTKTNLC